MAHIMILLPSNIEKGEKMPSKGKMGKKFSLGIRRHRAAENRYSVQIHALLSSLGMMVLHAATKRIYGLFSGLCMGQSYMYILVYAMIMRRGAAV